MKRKNPFETQISYVAELKKALNNEPNIKPRPGGKQFSVRFVTEIEDQLNTIENISGWAKNDIILALVLRGLYDFYDLLTFEEAAALIKKLAIPLLGFEHIQGEHND